MKEMSEDKPMLPPVATSIQHQPVGPIAPAGAPSVVTSAPNPPNAPLNDQSGQPSSSEGDMNNLAMVEISSCLANVSEHLAQLKVGCHLS